MRRKVTDFIASKQEELIALNEESAKSIDLVTSTINNLMGVNEKIDKVMEEISDAKKRLDNTESELSNRRLRNAKIVSNFQKILEV